MRLRLNISIKMLIEIKEMIGMFFVEIILS